MKRCNCLHDILRGYRKTFCYSGRDSRVQYFTLVSFQLLWFGAWLNFIIEEPYHISLITLLIFLLPLVASNIRRINDSGYSPALALLWFIAPYVLVVVFFFPRSAPADKKRDGEPAAPQRCPRS